MYLNTVEAPLLCKLSVFDDCGDLALDTLPHCGAIFVLFSIYGLNHKTAYKHCFWMTVVNTSICTVIGILFLTVLGL